MEHAFRAHFPYEVKRGLCGLTTGAGRSELKTHADPKYLSGWTSRMARRINAELSFESETRLELKLHVLSEYRVYGNFNGVSHACKFVYDNSEPKAVNIHDKIR